jgi:PAS domain S-box-containing protein
LRYYYTFHGNYIERWFGRMASIKQILSQIILGQKGGEKRAKIIEILKERPYNINQMADDLNLNYRTIRHHVDILVESGLIAPSTGNRYGDVYFLTPLMEENYQMLTELSRKLRNLTASPKFFQMVIERTSDAVIIIDMDTDVLFWNEGAEKIYGYKSSEIIGLKLPIFKNRKFLEMTLKQVKEKKSIISQETKALTMGGEVLHMAVTVDGIEDSNGKITACIILSRDITEQKEATEKIERLASFLSLNPNPVFEVDSSGAVTYYNEGAIKTLDRIDAARDVKLFFPPDISEIINKLKKGKLENIASEIKIEDAIFYLSIHIIPNMKVVRFYVVDITNLKRMEAELLAKELNFRVAADFTYDWEYWVDSDNRFVYISPSCERITSYMREEFMREPNLLLDIVHPDDRDRVATHFRDEKQHKELYEFEFRIIDKEKRERWIAHACRPVIDEAGRSLGCRVSNREITQRRKAEFALRESEERFRVITEMMPSMVSVSRISDDAILFTNLSFDRTFGYNKGELIGQKTPVLYYNPEDRVTLAEELERHGIVLDKELQVKRSDGTPFWVQMSTRKIHYRGEPALLGTSFDITRRKRLDEELRTYKERYEKLIESQKSESKKTKR